MPDDPVTLNCPAGALPPLPTQPPDARAVDPAPEFAILRDTEPVSRAVLGDGTPIWLLTRYEDVSTVLRDPRFSSDITRPRFPIHGLPGRNTPEFARSIIRVDAPHHVRLRRLMAKEFAPRQIATLEDDVRGIVDRHVDALEAAGPPGDFATDFALAVPSSTIGVLLGVPADDYELFQESTREHTRRDASNEEVARSLRELAAYMRRLAEAKTTEPGRDLMSQLVDDERLGLLDRDEVVSYAVLLVAAGHDTTAGALALGVLTLLEHPAQLDRLRREPQLWDRAVDELLRFHSVVRGGPRRLALEDVEIGGQLIRKDEGVMASVWAANHDGSHFDEPGRIDVSRPNAGTHLAFGAGPHLCLGRSLAQLELRIGFQRLFERFPGLRLAVPYDELPFRTDSTNHGLYSLPLAW